MPVPTKAALKQPIETETDAEGTEWRVVKLQCSQKQRHFLQAVLDNDSPYEVIGIGGARGGGKSSISVLAAILICAQYPDVKGLLLRKGLASAINNFRDEAKRWLKRMGMSKVARWYPKDGLFRFTNGSELHLGFCAKESDYERYMGVQYDFIGLEEATQHLALAWDLIGGSNRPNNPAYKSKRWLSCNPGGPGHKWVKERFVDERTRWPKHLWIPITVEDNPAMMIADPDYVKRVLEPLKKTQPYKYRQWRKGDWDAIAGQYFDVSPWNVVVVPKHELQRGVDWYAGVDWGRAKPFAVVYMARWKVWRAYTDPKTGAERHLGLDRAHIYKEIYQAGLGLDEQAQLVLDTEKTLPLNGRSVVYYADPATGKQLEGVSTEAGRTFRETWAIYGFYAHPARTNARVPGWDLIKMLMRTHSTAVGPHTVLTISPDCTALLNELGNLQSDGAPGPPVSEDLQQGPHVEDHAADALRYLCASTFALNYSVDRKSAYEE